MKNATLPRIFFLLLVALFSAKLTHANIVIPKPTGGVGISANKSPGGSSAGFTGIGDIVLTDAASSDFQASQLNKTIIFPAPANWAFNAGAGSITFTGPTITSASVLVTATEITVTFSTGATSGVGNSITIKDIAVQSTLNITGSASIVRNGGTAVIAGLGNNVAVASLSQVAGILKKLLVLMPGEVYAAGTSTGKTAALPTPIIAGVQFNTTVRSTDEFWNPVSSTDLVKITSTDPRATLVASIALAGGIRNIATTLATAGTQSVTAENLTAPLITSNKGSDVIVGSGPYVKLQILLPGEVSAPGRAGGKVGSPIPQTAGVPFEVTVNAVNANWEIITTAPSDLVTITSTDANAVPPAGANLSSGTQKFTVTLITGTSRTITATNSTDITKTANTSPSFIVSPNTINKLLLIMPGELYAPGTLTGKTGTATDVTAGSRFTITVKATDQYWNTVPSVRKVKIESADPGATVAASTTLANGTVNITTTILWQIGSQFITAVDLTASAVTSSKSATVNVIKGPYAKLQILLPGETSAPGISSGKTGTPTAQTAGVPFSVTVNAVNANWDIITGAPTDEITITSSDLYAVLPINANLSGGTQTFSVTLKAAVQKTITATNTSDALKTASVSTDIIVSASAVNKLLVLMPGEVYAPGTPTGKTGSANNVTAGLKFTIIVKTTDQYWNTAPSVHKVKIESADPDATVPTSTTLANGTVNITTTILRQIGLQFITAVDLTEPSITSNQGSNVTVVKGPYIKLQVLLPGEISAPGTPTGKTGTRESLIAGGSFNVIVNAVNANWDIITDAPADEISLTSTDLNAFLPSNAILSGGTRTFSVTLITAGSRRITASNITNGAIAADSNTPFTVGPGTFTKLQLLLPGEISAPGFAGGKTGNPIIPALGTPFTITVRAVDNNWNFVSSKTDMITLTSNNPAVVLPPNANLVGGTKDFSVTLNTLGTQQITATGGGFSTTIDVSGATLITDPNGYFRSAGTGNFNNTTTWESSSDNVTWTPATSLPTFSSAGITIRATHIVTLTASVSLDDFSVLSGGQLNINPLIELYIDNVVAVIKDFTVFGTVQNAGTINTFGGMFVESGGIYRHTFLAAVGTIPKATWLDGSTCEIVGYTSATSTTGASTFMNGLEQSFYDFTWNCPNQNVVVGPTLALGGTIVRNNFKILNTGIGSFVINTATSSTVKTLKVNNYIHSGGNVTTAGSIPLIEIAGNFDMSGGSLDVGATGIIAFTNSVVQNFTKTGGTLNGASNTDIAVTNLTVNNSAGVKLQAGDLSVSGTLAISSGSLDLGTSLLTAVTLNSGSGTLITKNTSAQPLPSGITWTLGVAYNAAASQTIVDGFYTNLNGEGGLRILPPVLSIAGAFTPGPSVNYTTTGNTIDFNKAGAQTIPAFKYNNLTVSNGGVKTVMGDATVSGTVDVKLGTLNANSQLTLLADKFSNANVASLPAGASVTGNVNVQVFLSGKPSGGLRGTRSLSSPLKEASLVGKKTFAQLKDDLILLGKTGAIGGFDEVPFVNGSKSFLDFYKEANVTASGNFENITDINTTVPTGKGFFAYFIGNRDYKDSKPGKLRTPFVDPEDVTVTYTGPINSGDISVPVAYTNHGESSDGRFFAGNPYPATINWDSVWDDSGNLNPTIIIVKGGQSNATYNAFSGNYVNGGSRYLKTGQGFYVQASSASGGSVNFKESSKEVVQSPAVHLMAAKIYEPNLLNKSSRKSNAVSANNTLVALANKLRLEMKKDGLEEESLIVAEHSFSNGYDQDDSMYLPGVEFGMGFSTITDEGLQLAIHSMATPLKERLVKLFVSSSTSGPSVLSFKSLEGFEGFTFFIKDNYTNVTKEITTEKPYSFSIERTNAASYGMERLALSFVPPTVLSIVAKSFLAVKRNEGIDLTWKTTKNENITSYTVERMGTDKYFTEIATYSNKALQFNFLDRAPLKGINYYRIKVTSVNGEVSYSEIRAVNFGIDAQVKAYPNPLQDVLYVDLSNEPFKKIQIKIYDSSGVSIKAEVIMGGDIHKIYTNGIPTGVYILDIKDVATGKILLNSKLIKN